MKAAADAAVVGDIDVIPVSSLAEAGGAVREGALPPQDREAVRLPQRDETTTPGMEDRLSSTCPTKLMWTSLRD